MAKKKKQKLSQLKKKRVKKQKRQAKVRQRLFDKHQEQVEQGLAPPRKLFKWRDLAQKGKLRSKVKTESKRLTAWYMDQSLLLKVGFGLVIIPILITLFLLQGVILPFLATCFGLMITLSKLAFIWVKGGAFIIYISYKVFKFLLGIYYCISRSISGWQAHKFRNEQATLTINTEVNYPALQVSTELTEQVKLESKWKVLNLDVNRQETSILFSYLRYFLLGQIFMYQSFWFDRQSYLTLWTAESRERVKEIFSTIGKTIFTPHLLGAHLNQKRILVPGDAKLLKISQASHQNHIEYQFEVKWQEWSFNKKWPFIHSSPTQDLWSIEVPSTLDLLETYEVGYTLAEKK